MIFSSHDGRVKLTMTGPPTFAGGFRDENGWTSYLDAPALIEFDAIRIETFFRFELTPTGELKTIEAETERIRRLVDRAIGGSIGLINWQK